ncbi:AAA family ATPase [Shewanella baltica]|uniref:RNA-binding domain-containing protein n=1 Tax=Shewanella baltica TaxID=62322 RepID=UPI00217ED25C|nr:RNA-binding domain-containing protein [Shewanella baltica]MCS6129612.1 AAA family ATPase [Shewanella baltica]MCS6141573.1 AAA family ATPase [Shewanella baltica]MCS6147907.1 AAA family ATPase [Shewanella baltica]MCS6172436.1 AAA family ATPase [Shewanella baltica]MCS6189660.1 AAA family ATPase [Shewanella baltica]
MFQIQDLVDLQALSESAELEFKLAQGQDGKGKLPDDFWPTYSAMANSRGGYVVLGVREKKGQLTLAGIEDIEIVHKQLFDIAGNNAKVNINLLTNDSVQTVNIEGKSLLVIEIPTARRDQKPIYLKNQPMKETYTRLHEGDHRCSEEQVKRMMAEQVEDSRDDKILTGFDFSDIDMDSLKAYKNLFSVAKPQHPWLELDLFELFKKLGGWRKDRQTSVEGITLAGVLMFGTWDAIQDAVPNYFVDYRERDEASVERWVDRLYPDGSWSGNVFDFYRRTYRKLVTDLKVPFELQNGIRLDDSKAHEAIREALVNTLVHADYTGRSSILIVKRPDLFGFRNPGLMRVPPEIAVKGGESDCRNRRMHQMFLMIGAGERAGSGIPKIYSGWEWAKWRTPKLYEKYEPSEQTLLELSTASLIPEEVTQLLAVKFGNTTFYSLNELEQMIVVTAAIEGWVNHERACQLTSKHSRDVTLALPRLVDKGFLVASGKKRDKSYSLPGMELPSPEEVFSNALTPINNLTHNAKSLTHSTGNLTHNNNNAIVPNETRDDKGRFISCLIDKPFVDSLDVLSESFRQELNALAAPAREQRRLDTVTMKSLISGLCQEHYISVSVLEMILDRKPQSLRQNYLKPMISEGLLKMAFPHKPNSPKQGYTTAD